MIRPTTALLSLSAFALPLTAQVSPTNGVRDIQTLSSVTGSTDNAQVEMPKENLSAPAGSAGLVHTGRLAYVVFEADDAAGNDILVLRRSTDGGCSFEAPQVIWTGVAGESIAFHRLVATEHHVFVAIETERNSQGLSPDSDEYVWVTGSDQQGLPGTFQDVLVSTGQDQLRSDGTDLNDVDVMRASGGAGRCYVCFESDYDDDGTGSSSGSEDIFFRTVEFNAGTLTARGTESIRINTLAAATSDVDFPIIASDGDTVALTWRENRGGIDDDQWVRASTDGGLTFQGEENLTNFTSSTGQEVGSIAVDGLNVYVVSTDERNTGVGSQDQVFLSFSNTGGAPGSFQTARVDTTPAGLDADVGQVTAANNIVYVFYESLVLGEDELFVAVSNQGGAQFLNGTSVTTQITSNAPDGVLTISNAGIPSGDAFGNVCAFPVVRDTDPSLFDVAFSRDAGQTWELRNLNDVNATGGRTLDRDVAVGTRNEILVAMQDNRNNPASLGTTDVFLTGLRLGVLEYDSAAELFTMSSLPRPDLLQLAVLFPSLAAPSCGGLVLSRTNGWQSNLTADVVTPQALEVPGFIAVVPAGTDATWLFPNVAASIGLPVYYAGATVSGTTGEILSVSDAIVQM